MKNKVWYHILAVATVVVWGTTFINAKVLLVKGMTAHEIFFLRFLLAYACIVWIAPRKLLASSWKDELRMAALGLTGGSLYFVMQNMALDYTFTNNVSFIVSCSPLLATLIALAVDKEVKATVALTGGSILALAGVGLVIFNGHLLKLSPVGDLLSLLAAFSWAVYSLLIKRLSDRYSSVFITRKVFFYGLFTVLPVFLFRSWTFPLAELASPPIFLNLLYLGFVASFVCFAVWSLVIKKLGALKATNYIYLNPMSTMLTSALFLDEPVTIIAFIGCVLILLGVFWAGRDTHR